MEINKFHYPPEFSLIHNRAIWWVFNRANFIQFKVAISELWENKFVVWARQYMISCDSSWSWMVLLKLHCWFQYKRSCLLRQLTLIIQTKVKGTASKKVLWHCNLKTNSKKQTKNKNKTVDKKRTQRI